MKSNRVARVNAPAAPTTTMIVGDVKSEVSNSRGMVSCETSSAALDHRERSDSYVPGEVY